MYEKTSTENKKIITKVVLNQSKYRGNVATNYNKKLPIHQVPGVLHYRDKIYSDYSAFASSATFSTASAGASAFFVERRLRRVFLASAFGDLAIFSL